MRWLLALTFAAIGCNRPPDVTRVAPGTEIELTRRDGGVVHGKLARLEGRNAVIATGSRERTVLADDVADLRVVDPRADRDVPVPLPAIARFREYTIPEGTPFTIRLDTAAASDSSRVDDRIEARLVEPIMVEGVEVLPAGSVVEGQIAEAVPAGHGQGRASLAIRLDSLRGIGGESYAIAGRLGAEASAPTKGEDAKKIGIPAGGGAILGALLGGKKGAAIGAVAGAGVGTAVVLTTPGQEVRWPDGTALTFRLEREVDVRVPIKRL
jgi:hypothetical protein